MFVYLIVNDVNLKIYVGKTIQNNLDYYLQHKFAEARRSIKAHSHFYAAIRKYGREHFHIFPLYEGTTNEEICEQEKLLIKALGTQNHKVGYNICRGGQGHTGAFSVEHREKIRVNRLLQPDPRLGTHHSDETKKRISEAKKGTPSWMHGRQHTEESNEKNRQAHIHDLQGQQFGNVLVVSLAGTSGSHAEWTVHCTACGAEGIVRRGGRVKNGDSAFMRAHKHSIN